MSLSAPIASWWQGGAEKCMTGPCEQVQRADLEPRRRSGPRRAGGNGAELIHGRQPAISRSSLKVRLRGLLATPVDVTYPSVTPCHKVSGISGTSIMEASATCARCLFWAVLAVFEPAEKPDYSHAFQKKQKRGWRPCLRDDRQWVRETVAPTTGCTTARTPSRDIPARDGCLPATVCLAMRLCLPV